MAAVAPNNQLEVLGQRFNLEPKPNPNFQRPAIEHVNEYLKTTNGTFRYLQLTQRIISLAAVSLKESGGILADTLNELSGKLLTSWSMLAFPRLWDVTLKVSRVMRSDVRNVSPAVERRNQLEKIHALFDAASTWGYAALIVTASPFYKKIADVHTLGADVADLAMTAQDYTTAQAHLNVVGTKTVENGKLHDQMSQTMRSTSFKLAKCVIAVFTGVLALLTVGINIYLSILLSLAGTVCAVGAHFWQEMKNPYEKIDFFKVQTPVIVV